MRLCDCGCGEETPIAAKTDRRKGHVKGEPLRFMQGHFGRTLKRQATMALQYFRTDIDAEITEADLVRLRDTNDVDAAEILDARVVELERRTKRSFIELGLICLEVKRRELWKNVIAPDGTCFHSLDAWMATRLGVSARSAYSAMKVLKLEDVAVNDLREMPRCNAQHLAEWSPEVHRDPVVIATAKQGSEKELLALVQKRHPDQHAEPRRMTMATLDDSVRSLMEECFTVARWVYDVEKREDVLELLFRYFMDGPCEHEGYSNRSNREAFAAARKRGAA